MASKFETFEPSQETFSCFVQRMKIYFSAQEISVERQKFVFLSALGRKHFTLLANLVSPAEPETRSFDELVEVLTKHFQPTSCIISERYGFHCRCQKPDETITDFVAGLRKLIIRCSYDRGFQETFLRDRFVCGLAYESTRKRLLTEDNTLTFE